MRLRTNTQGDAFTLPVDFDTPIVTVPGVKYTLSMFTLINCQKVGCEAAKDKISVQIKEGLFGEFTEVYSVSGRSRDTKWIKDSLNFIATNTRVYVRIMFLKKGLFFKVSLY